MGYTLNGVESGGIPVRLVKKLTDNHLIPYFIETGTAGGQSVNSVAHLFSECDTIELIEGRQYNSISKESYASNINCHSGHSVDRLPEIIHEIIEAHEANKEPLPYALFWLDAHYSDPEPNTSDNDECPLLDEIKIIKEKYAKPVFLIDDARLFFGHPPYPNDPREWPTLQEIFRTLPEHYFTTIIDDYIISIPIEMVATFQEEWRDNYKHRYPDADTALKQHLKAALTYFKVNIDAWIAG